MAHRSFLILKVFALLSTSAFGQLQILNVPSNLRMPRDSTFKKEIIHSVDQFLSQIQKPNRENDFVWHADLLETSALMDEMKDLRGYPGSPNDSLFKPYLVNLTLFSDTSCLVQIAYLGVRDGIPLLRASFTLLGQRKGHTYYFSSPLKKNTMAWKNQKFGRDNIYYKNNLNDSNARKYFQMITFYDQKLNAPEENYTFYCADNFHEVLQLVGVDYKFDYNGYMHNALTAKENGANLSVNGSLTSDFTAFDPHDLWHERLHNVLSTDRINRPVDEGTAYLYGGSWGLSWNEILNRFKVFAHANPNASWVSLYNESKNFDEGSRYPLNVDFVINGLIVQEIEKEKGFASVMELLSCGKKQPRNDNYFIALEKITGINKESFNSYVWTLLRED